MAIKFETNFEEMAPIEIYCDEKEALTAEEAIAVSLADIARSMRKIADEMHEQSMFMAESRP